jgi:hypothetical protein
MLGLTNTRLFIGLSRFKDRLVIELKINEKHIRARNMGI